MMNFFKALTYLCSKGLRNAFDEVRAEDRNKYTPHNFTRALGRPPAPRQ